MAGKNIKSIRIETTSTGAKAATKEIKDLDLVIENATKSISEFSSISKTFNKSLSNMAAMSSSVSSLDKSLGGVAKSVKALNSATAGTKAQTAKLEGYITNIEVLGSVLIDLARNANVAEHALDGINAASGMSSLIGILERIENNTAELGVTADKTAEYITDLEVTTNRTGEELEQMAYQAREAERAAAGLGKASAKTNNDTRRLSEGGRGAAKSFSALAFGANPVVSAYAAIAVNIFAVTAAFRLLNEAASFERLKTQTAGFSASVSGLNVKALAQDMQEASAGALTLKDSLSFATRGVSYNFGADALKELTIGARKASVALGTEFSDALDRVLRGISKKEIEVLDEVGVITTLTAAYTKYADRIGKTIEELTEFDKQTALTTEVLTQLNEKFKGVELNTTGWEKLGVAVSDFATSSLGSLSKTLGPVAESLAYLTTLITDTPTGADQAAESLKIFNEALASGDVIQAGVAMNQYKTILEETAQSQIDNADQIAKIKEDDLRLTRVLTTAVILLGTAIVGAYGASVVAAITGSLVAIGTAMRTFITVMRSLTTANLLMSASIPVLGLANLARFAVVAAASVVAVNLAFKEFNSSPKPDDIGINPQDWIATAAAVSDMKQSLLDAGFDTDVVGGLDPEKLLSWSNAVDTSAAAVDSIVNSLKPAATPMDKLITQFGAVGLSAINLTKEVGDVQKQLDLIDGFKQSGLIPAHMEVEAFTQALRDSRAAGEEFKDFMSTGLKVKSIELAGRDMGKLTLIQSELNAKKDEYKRITEGVGKIASTDVERDKLKSEILVLAAKETSLILTTKEIAAQEDLALQHGKALATLQEIPQYESAILRLKGNQLAQDIALLKTQNINTDSKQRELDLLNKQLKVQISIEATGKTAAEQSTIDTMALESLRARTSLESDILDLQIEQLKTKAASLSNEDPAKAELQEQIKLLENKQKLTKVQEGIDSKTSSLSRDQGALALAIGRAGSEREKVLLAQENLDIEKKKIALMSDEFAAAKATLALSVEQDKLDARKDAAPGRDISNTLGSIAGLEGIPSVLSGVAEGGSVIAASLADAAEAGMTGFDGFSEYLSGNLQGFIDMSTGLANAAGSIYQSLSDDKVAGIDREIAAEKKRDGKSIESLALIKKLEAKKIKEQAKAKKAQVVISTATAIMQGYAQLGPIAGHVAAAAMAAMGLYQIAQIDKASQGSIDGISAGSGSVNTKIEGGSRSNDIDTSRNSNAGELAYVSGQRGNGTAQNFQTPGRAGRGSSAAGASIIVGERGPEEITPQMPVNVSGIGESSGGGGGGFVFSPMFQIDTVDSNGFEDLTKRFSKELYDGLETELRARNLTLESLA